MLRFGIVVAIAAAALKICISFLASAFLSALFFSLLECFNIHSSDAGSTIFFAEYRVLVRWNQ